MYILGISAFYHDSAAALIKDGIIIAAAQEERFTRNKFDQEFPANAIVYCLKEAGIKISNLSCIVFYDKPLIKFERILETYLACAPKGFISFNRSIPMWIKEKLFLKELLKKELSRLGGIKKRQLPPIFFTEHHQSHAASAFYPSPFKKAAILCLDGVGEWATVTVWLGEGNKMELQWQLDFPHSLGLLYSAFTYYTGFKVNSGEYKVMGLAPYGKPKYTDLILEKLLDLKEDGTFRLNMKYFNYTTGITMTNSRFNALFEGPPRKPESKLTQKEMDIGASIQKVTEEVVLRLVRTLHKELEVDYLCLAGGVALNCVANGRILKESQFKDIWVQPAAGDAGGALGAVLATWYQYYGNRRNIPKHKLDSMQGAYLGPSFNNDEVKAYLNSIKAAYIYIPNEDDLCHKVAAILKKGFVVGWFHGRMEFGPRALGNRSILGDSRNPKMQSIMNLKIKYRESFRPFAPAVLFEDVNKYFELNKPSPYMLLTATVNENLRFRETADEAELFGINKLKVQHSSIPAVTHVDYSARIQTVHPDTNPRFHKLLACFKELTGCSVLVNTSFNVRGEPIVCTPEDAYHCFMRTEMDYLILENYFLAKPEQPSLKKSEARKKRFTLD